MNKHSILNNYSNEDDKLLVSKTLDKLNYSIQKNKITYTHFMNSYEYNLVLKMLNSLKFKNYIFYGGFEGCERKLIIFYPEKFDISVVYANYTNILSVIRIELPKQLYNNYNHRDYLGALIKLGLTRDKIGDIIVFENGADIIVSKEIEDYLLINLKSLTRFQKSEIQIESIENLRTKKIQKEEIKLIIPSLRLDSVVSQICHTSRTKATEIINSEKVFVNYTCVTKTSYILKEKDILTVRKFGKYDIVGISGNTRKGNIILKLEKYI